VAGPGSPRQDQLNDSNAERADSDGIGNLNASQPDAPRKDATGNMRSVKQDGGKIFVRKSNNGLIAISIVYEGDTTTTETYVFQIDDRGNGTVVSSLTRTSGIVNKMSLMTAQCRGGS